MPEPDAGRGEGAPPAIVAQERHRCDVPLARVAEAIEQAAVELVVAIAHDVGLDDHLVAGEPLGGEAAAIHVGAHPFDSDAPAQVRGELTRFFRHGRLRRDCVWEGRGAVSSQWPRGILGKPAASRGGSVGKVGRLGEFPSGVPRKVSGVAHRSGHGGD